MKQKHCNVVKLKLNFFAEKDITSTLIDYCFQIAVSSDLYRTLTKFLWFFIVRSVSHFYFQFLLAIKICVFNLFVLSRLPLRLCAAKQSYTKTPRRSKSKILCNLYCANVSYDQNIFKLQGVTKTRPNFIFFPWLRLSDISFF